MKSLRELLAKNLQVKYSEHPDDDPGWEVIFCRYVSWPFDSEQGADRGKDMMLDRMEEAVREYLLVAFDEPPMTEGEISVVEGKRGSGFRVGIQEDLLQMIRWQQAVICRMAQDNGYQEGYAKGRRDEAREAYKVMQNMMKETAKVIRTL